MHPVGDLIDGCQKSHIGEVRLFHRPAKMLCKVLPARNSLVGNKRHKSVVSIYHDLKIILCSSLIMPGRQSERHALFSLTDPFLHS
jgi:hypothetical protein